jgi:endonuclease/exonuclease/phosphatase family metal-dependent hydrolase
VHALACTERLALDRIIMVDQRTIGRHIMKKRYGALLRLKSTGLFRRCGRDAIRGTKTVLAVLAILASVLAWGSAPVRAEDNDGDLGSHRVRVLAQNMYIGASLHDLVTATSVADAKTAINNLVLGILATKPRERAAAMAAEIAKQRPDFVALSEAWKLTVDGVVKMDLLQWVIDELKALGQPYELASDGKVDGFVNQEDLNAAPLGLNIRLTDRNAILMRTDVDIATIGVEPRQFTAQITLTLSTGLPPPQPQQIKINISGGYVSVDAMVRGLPLRFLSVHLIPDANTIGLHTAELLKNEVLPPHSTKTLVFGGDFNTTADDPKNLSFPIYQLLIGAGLTDAWKLLHPDQPGFTCCQAPDLLNKRSNLDLPPCPPGSTAPPPGSTATTCPHRIDLILFRGLAGVDNMKVFGDRPPDRTPSGLWPSDHAGIVATLAGPESQ